MPVPITKGNDITVRIEALSKRKEVTPFEVKSLQREISKLKAVSPAEAYMLGGMLAGMLGDREESKTQHEKSIALEYEVVGLFNYGVSMKKVGELSLAKDLFARTAEMAQGDLEVFEHQLQTFSFLLDYRDFEVTVRRMEKVRPDVDFSQIQDVSMFRNHLQNLAGLGISLDEYSKYGLCAEKALLNYDMSAVRVSERVSSFDGLPHMFVEFFVDSNSVDALFEVNEHLVDLIMNDEALTNWDKVILSVAREEQDRLDSDGAEQRVA